MPPQGSTFARLTCADGAAGKGLLTRLEGGAWLHVHTLRPELSESVAAAAAVTVVTPDGLLVEISTEGRVLMSPLQPREEAGRPLMRHATGVDVHGAPVAGGYLDGQLPAVLQSAAWHAILPDGTLIKAASASRGMAGDGRSLTLLHVDGWMSQRVEAGAGQLPGWIFTGATGACAWLTTQEKRQECMAWMTSIACVVESAR